MKPSKTMCRQSGKSQTSVGAVHRPSHPVLSESTVNSHSVDGVAGGSCMYGLSDNCPVSVNRLSLLLELIS